MLPKIFILHSPQDGIIDSAYVEASWFDKAKLELARKFLVEKAKTGVSISTGNHYRERTGHYNWTQEEVNKYYTEHHPYCVEHGRECRCPKFEPITAEVIAGVDAYKHACNLVGFIQWLEDRGALVQVEFEALP